MNAIKINDNVKITFSDGTSVDLQNVEQEELEFIVSNFGNEELLKNKYCPEEYRAGTLIKRIEDSDILTLRGNNIYMLSVAPIAMPEDLAEKLLDAEEEEDEESLTKYTNFWKLVALNPDHRVRANLFWFIRKWGVTITEYGFLKCYRNVDIKKEVDYSPEEMRNIISNYYKAKYLDGVNPENIPYGKSNLAEVYHTITNEGIATVFTDAHSHTFTIKIGTPVSMPREEVDCEQEHSCSSGLNCSPVRK